MTSKSQFGRLTLCRLFNVHKMINRLFVGRDAFFVVLCTVFTALMLQSSRKMIAILSKHGVLGTIQLVAILTIKKVPGGQKLIESELEKTRRDLQRELKPSPSKHAVHRQIPQKGVGRQLIREELLFQLSLEQKVRAQRGHGGIYVNVAAKYNKYLASRTEADSAWMSNLSVKEETYLLFSHSNTLYPFLFPGTRKFDTELIAMASDLLGAKEPAGTITAGGTESIFLAMKCWRSYGEKTKGITAPNVVLCVTAHPAFVKAAHYLRIEAKFVGIRTDDECYGTVDLSKMSAAIDDDTICLVGSAPCFPYSVVDDIEGICAIAKQRGDIPVHVDNCLGGFCLSFLSEQIPFDFRVDGVSSISIDLHKQLGADKGCSSVIYDRFQHRRHQYYSYTTWPGGLYCSSGFQGSSNGGLVAVAWATLLSKGRDTLKANAERLHRGVNALSQQITEKVDECDVLGRPVACGVAFKFSGRMSGCDYAVAEALQEVGGWEVVRLQFPSALFFQASQGWIDDVDQLVEDLLESVRLVRGDPAKYKTSGMAGIYGTAATFPDRSLIEETCATYLDVIHSPQ